MINCFPAAMSSGEDSDSGSSADGGAALQLFSSATHAAARSGAAAAAAAAPGGPPPSSDDESGRDGESGASVGSSGALAASRGGSFSALGLSDWLCRCVSAMGISTPTAVQSGCIPAVLCGKDVMGCSPTGSGKTAAFALPILERLAEDPYGINAVVLTPARELAAQIADQFSAFGAGMGVRVCTVIGGMDQATQGRELARRPHVVVATPGRLAHHLKGGSGSPPALNRVRYVVLDEADRLLDASFARDIATIFEALPPSGPRRQTLLFSATMTANLHRLEELAVRDPFRWAATAAPRTVDTLRQVYCFVPLQVKLAYLAYLVRTVGPGAVAGDDGDDEDAIDGADGSAGAGGKSRSDKAMSAKRKVKVTDSRTSLAAAHATEALRESFGRASSCIIFTSTQHGCQLLAETLTELGVLCVALHSVMSQRRRLAALGKFRSSIVRVLIATDVASRGLDIPEVELVINYDVPRNPDDYIHRVGRTARAGRGGKALTLISQYDVELVHRIEDKMGLKMEELEGVVEDAVLARLNKVSTAERVARLRMAETGFDERLSEARERKRRSREAQAAYLHKGGDDTTKRSKRKHDGGERRKKHKGKKKRVSS